MNEVGDKQTCEFCAIEEEGYFCTQGYKIKENYTMTGPIVKSKFTVSNDS